MKFQLYERNIHRLDRREFGFNVTYQFIYFFEIENPKNEDECHQWLKWVEFNCWFNRIQYEYFM